MISQLKEKYRNLSDNNKSILINVFGAFSVKGAALVLSLFTMPAYLRYFNEQSALGVWFTILSVLSWILNFDLGIGNGLRNHLARTIATGEKEEAKNYISAAYISIGVLVAGVIVLFWCIFEQVDWNQVFHIEGSVISASALNTVVLITFIGIMGQLFLKLICSVLYAVQKSAINNLMNLLTSILIFLYVVFASSHDNDRNMITMAWVHTLAVLFPLLVATLLIFGTKLCYARPSLRCFHFFYAKQVLSLGGVFFFVQIVYMLIMSTNEYLITAFSASEYVVEYQIYAKLFTLGGATFSLALTPIWSIVTKVLTQKDFTWVKKLYRQMLIFGGIGCVAEFLLVPFLQPFLNLWLGDRTIVANPWYGVVFAIMGSFMIMNSVLSSIANGAGELKTQAIFFCIGAVIKIPIAFILVTLIHSWIGVVIANAIAMGLYCLVQPFWLNKYINNVEKRDNEPCSKIKSY